VQYTLNDIISQEILFNKNMKSNFGVEIEINSFDGRNFLDQPLRRGESPQGIKEIANIIKNIGLEADIQPWGYNHNNTKWICKPDSSCGIEVCSPVLSNKRELLTVIDSFSKDERIKIDNNCSFHVHVEIEKIKNIFDSDLLCSILVWWIKCEHVFIDWAAPHRKQNRYCRFIGKTDLFDHEEKVSKFRVISKLSDKYLSLNTYHLINKNRNTIEFRLGEGTKDVLFVNNWIDLINCFLESSTKHRPPKDYKLLDCESVFEFLNLKEDLKFWFLERLVNNCDKTTEIGKYSYSRYLEILEKFYSNQCFKNINIARDQNGKF